MSHNVTSPPGILPDIAVIGAGTMGNGIAHVCAQHGRQVTLVDLSEQLLQRGLETIAKNPGRQVAKEVLTRDEADATLGRIQTTTEVADVKAADLVVEAVSESTDLKRRTFADLDGLCPPETILASNTSSISITLLGAATKRPDKVIGMHFMNPVPVMKLVEVIRRHDTSDKTHDTVVALAAMVKVFASEAAMRAATRCVQIQGGYGYIRETGVERLMRDAKITQIYEGTSEIQRVVIARELQKKG